MHGLEFFLSRATNQNAAIEIGACSRCGGSGQFHLNQVHIFKLEMSFVAVKFSLALLGSYPQWVFQNVTKIVRLAIFLDLKMPRARLTLGKNGIRNAVRTLKTLRATPQVVQRHRARVTPLGLRNRQIANIKVQVSCTLG